VILVADAVRLTLACAGLALAVVCCAGAVLVPTWDQRARFLTMVGYSTIIIGGQLELLGQPPTWRTWALAVVTTFALVSTAAFLVRHVRKMRGGPRVGRSTDDQRSVQRTRPRARRARDTGHGPGTAGGGPTA
jgi:membrane protein implicated in regulation of membrane protease activity